MPFDAMFTTKSHGISFTLAVEDHIRRGESQQVTLLLASLPSPEVAQDFLRLGFVAKGQLSSFVETCLHHRQQQVLRDVLANAPHGLVLNDFCQCHEKSQGNGPVIYKSLHRAAVEFANPEALELAIELAPNDPALTEMFKTGSGQENVQTLHFMALYTAVSRNDFTEYLQNMANCARVLRRHGAPIRNISPHRGEKAAAADAFFGERWAPAFEGELLSLLAEYVEAGLVDVNLPSRYTMTRSDITYRLDRDAEVPLATVIRLGVAPAAGALIELGCDTSSALPKDAPDIKDLFDLVNSHQHDPDVEMRLKGAIAQAQMSVRLRQADQAAAVAPADTNPPPAPRRQRRTV